MTEEVFNLDEFLPIGTEEVAEAKPTILSKERPVDTSFLDEPEEKQKPKEDVSTIIDNLDKTETEEVDTDISKSLGKLFEKGVLLPFDDEKPIEKYTTKDWQELIEANIEEKAKSLREETEKTFTESLPEELKFAAKYVQDGGRDLKSLFKVLAQKEEVSELDVENDQHQEIILRQFLSASNFGSIEEIDEQIENWKETNQLGKWAKKHKPKLDAMYSKIVEKQLEDQENFKKEQQQRKEQYLDNVYGTIKKGELNGIKLDSKKQKFLYEELTNTKYESMTGRPTNLLGHLLEKYQFSKEPRYDLIAEALWLLQDPQGYKAEVSKIQTKELNEKTIRTLKTEQDRKQATTSFEEKEESIRKIQRAPRNIFARN